MLREGLPVFSQPIDLGVCAELPNVVVVDAGQPTYPLDHIPILYARVALEPLDGQIDNLLVEMITAHYDVVQTHDNLQPEDYILVGIGKSY